MNVTTVNTFRALHLQLHVVFSRCFAIFALFPAIAIPSVSHLLARIQQHSSTFWPRKESRRMKANSEQASGLQVEVNEGTFVLPKDISKRKV